MLKFNTKEEIVEALVNEFGEKKSSFYNTFTNKSREKFWTFNRLFHYYWDIKLGRKRTYSTQENKETGYYELKK